MASIDAKTTVVDALHVGRTSLGPATEYAVLTANSQGVAVTPPQDQHCVLQTDGLGNIVLDTDDSGNAEGNISLLSGFNIGNQYGLNAGGAPGTSRWSVYGGEISEYLLDCNGAGSFELQEYIDYVKDGDELWALLSDAVERRIYLKEGVTYSLPAGSGVREIGARKVVIGSTSSPEADKATIQLNTTDYLYIVTQCVFENIAFTSNWTGDNVSNQIVYAANLGTESRFYQCTFNPSHSPSIAAMYVGGYAVDTSAHFEGCTFYGSNTSGRSGLYFGIHNGARVERCTFVGGAIGLNVNDTGRGMVIEDCVFLSTSGSGIQLRLNNDERLVVRNSMFTKLNSALPGPAVEMVGIGKVLFDANYVYTGHTNATTWGSNYLISITGTAAILTNNEIVGQYMTDGESGLVYVGPYCSLFRCMGNTFYLNTDGYYGVVIDSAGIASSPVDVHITENHFRGLDDAGGAYILFIDSTAGVNDWAVGGVISNNSFESSVGGTYAINGSPPSGQEVFGYSVLGNIMRDAPVINQDVFEQSVIRNNVGSDTTAPVDPDGAERDNNVGDNIPPPPV